MQYLLVIKHSSINHSLSRERGFGGLGFWGDGNKRFLPQAVTSHVVSSDSMRSIVSITRPGISLSCEYLSHGDCRCLSRGILDVKIIKFENLPLTWGVGPFYSWNLYRRIPNSSPRDRVEGYYWKYDFRNAFRRGRLSPALRFFSVLLDIVVQLLIVGY